MLSELLLAVIVGGSLAAAIGTLVVVARDGYRRVPTDPTRIPEDVEQDGASPHRTRRRHRGRDDRARAVSATAARARDGMPRAAVTPTRSM